MIRVLAYILLFISASVFGQNYMENELTINSDKSTLNGTLLTVNSKSKTPLVIIIPGSGPTDRNGNSFTTNNNSLKFLAKALAEKNISSYRYDKSVVSNKKEETNKVDSLRFEHLINETKAVLQYFKNENKFSNVIVAGHSQGSLVGMIASANNADAFISLAGAGRTIDKIILEQIAKQAPNLEDETSRILEKLKKGKTVNEYNIMLSALFNKSVQPFLVSWIKYNPIIEIEKLKIPVLIVNGSNDIQISIKDAELLHKSAKNSKLEVIEHMNHIFKEIKGDLSENMKSYNNPELPIMTDFSNIITTFVNDLK